MCSDFALDRDRADLRRHPHVDINGADARKIVRPIRRPALDGADIDLRPQWTGGRIVDIFLLEGRSPLFQRSDDPRHLDDGIHFLHRELCAPGAPGRLRLAEGRDLDLHHSGLRPHDVEVRAVAAHGIVGMHPVGQQMVCADAFAAILLRLPCADRRTRNFSDTQARITSPLSLIAALLDGLSGAIKDASPPFMFEMPRP